MEVQADISASETASAVTCVSEKSNNTHYDNASTRALAGSMCRQVTSNDIAELYIALIKAQNGLNQILSLSLAFKFSRQWTHPM